MVVEKFEKHPGPPALTSLAIFAMVSMFWDAKNAPVLWFHLLDVAICLTCHLTIRW